MKDVLRKCIQQEKNAIKDIEIFGTQRYLALLKSITREITDGKFNQVKIYENPLDGFGGWWDGRTIAVNIANPLTQSFPDVNSRSDSIVGIMGHECGHKNYSYVELRRKYLKGIEDGIWYPKPPYAENTPEEDYLLQLKQCFQEKNPIALSVIKKTAAYINNVLEDVFIEGKMCAKYPGSICRGIIQNRVRKLERMPSLRQQANEGYQQLSIYLNMLVQYALSGHVNKWDGCEEIQWELFLTLCSVIDQAVVAEEASARFFATNQLILKLWPVIWGQVQGIQETQQEREKNPEKDNAGEGTATEDTSASESEAIPELEKALETLTEQFYDFLQKEASGKEEQSPSDGEWNGIDDGNNDNAMSTDEVETGNQENEANAKQVFQKSIDVGEDTQDILFEIAKERAEQKIQQDISEELRKSVKEVPFFEGHKVVRKEIKRSVTVTTDAIVAYRAYEEQIKRVMRRMKTALIPVLQKQDGAGEQKLLLGKKLDYKHISDFQGRIFQNKAKPGQNPQVSIGVLVDLSLSMTNGKRMDVAKLTTLCLYEFCRALHIPVTIYGHHTDGRAHSKIVNETVFLHSVAEFVPDSNDRYRILQMHPHGANRDGTALLYMGHKLLKRPEKQKILVLVSDGFPNANFYQGEEAKKDLLKIKKDLERKGILFLAAAIGSDKEAIKEIYQEAFLDISEIERLPIILSKQLLKRIRRRM